MVILIVSNKQIMQIIGARIMARLPQVGGDDKVWGDILNSYLLESHTADGALKANSVGSAQLQEDSITAAALSAGSVTEDQLDTNLQQKVNNNVKTTGDQTVAGVKTFSSLPVVPVTPTSTTHVASKSYVDSTVVASGHSGRELAYAESDVQATFADGSWHMIPGLTITFATTDRPAYITVNLGIVLTTTNNTSQVLIAILNVTDMEQSFMQEVTLAPFEGYGAAPAPIISFRVPAGTASKEYAVRIQNIQGEQTTVFPSWAGNSGFINAIEA